MRPVQPPGMAAISIFSVLKFFFDRVANGTPDTSKLATLFDRGLIHIMTIKLAYDAEVRTHRQGPQQTGTIWLTYKSELKEKLTSVIKDAKLATE